MAPVSQILLLPLVLQIHTLLTDEVKLHLTFVFKISQNKVSLVPTTFIIKSIMITRHYLIK